MIVVVWWDAKVSASMPTGALAGDFEGAFCPLGPLEELTARMGKARGFQHWRGYAALPKELVVASGLTGAKSCPETGLWALAPSGRQTSGKRLTGVAIRLSAPIADMSHNRAAPVLLLTMIGAVISSAGGHLAASAQPLHFFWSSAHLQSLPTV